MVELKQQWRTLKLDAKKSASNYKRSLKQTGGGMKPPSPDPSTQEIINMIKVPQEFVENECECDCWQTPTVIRVFIRYKIKPRIKQSLEGFKIYVIIQQRCTIKISTLFP
jgi:hypothetical protein